VPATPAAPELPPRLVEPAAPPDALTPPAPRPPARPPSPAAPPVAAPPLPATPDRPPPLSRPATPPPLGEPPEPDFAAIPPAVPPAVPPAPPLPAVEPLPPQPATIKMAADDRNREHDLVWPASKKHLRCTLKDDSPTTRFGGDGSMGRASADDPRLPSTISPGRWGVKESRGEVRLRTRLLRTGGDVAHGAPAPGATDVHSRRRPPLRSQRLP